MEFEPAPGPHAPRQRDRRQQPAAPRVTIGTQLRSPMPVQKKQPVPQRRQRIARLRLRILAIERGGQRSHRPGG